MAVVLATTAVAAKTATTRGDAGGGDVGRRGTTTWTGTWTPAGRPAAEDRVIVVMKVGDKKTKVEVLDVAADVIEKGEKDVAQEEELDMVADEIEKGVMDMVLEEIVGEGVWGAASRGARRWIRRC